MNEQNTTNNNSKPYVPLWRKVFLTINEASKLFGICDKHIRELTHEPDNYAAYSKDGFLVKNGNKYLIDRERFHDWVLNVGELTFDA